MLERFPTRQVWKHQSVVLLSYLTGAWSILFWNSAVLVALHTLTRGRAANVDTSFEKSCQSHIQSLFLFAVTHTCLHTVMAWLDTVCRPRGTTDHSLHTAASSGSTCGSTRKNMEILKTHEWTNECAQHLSPYKFVFVIERRLKDDVCSCQFTFCLRWNASSGVNSHRVRLLIKMWQFWEFGCFFF